MAASGGSASGGVSAGSVYVDVHPRTTGFWAAFVAQTTPGATAAGNTLGAAFGAAMAARIRAAVNGSLSGLTSNAARHGAALGNRFGGTFATTAEQRIRAALRALPEYRVNIYARATDAERKMRELRDQLERLSTKRIGIDITETQAREEVARLRAELDRLAATASSPRVRVDTGRASIELALLEQQLERLDGRRAGAEVDVDTDRARIGVNRLTDAILTIGPAAVPAAAAAAAAIGGIGAAAVIAAPSVGVLALAFGGIGGAVTALANAQREQQKTGNTAVQQQKSLASSSDQVRSAVASLANTRANAADQQRRSLQQIADAERAVTRAQEAATRAQESLNDAREEERRSQEDTAQALKRNAVDQAKAATQVADLQRQLASFGGENTANALAEAQEQAEELAITGRRLTADQERDRKTGIDGSKRVLEAQRQLAEAQQKVTDAVRAEGEARLQAASQARQAAFQIAQGQAAIAAAQRAAGAALSATASTAGSALDKLDEELQTLPLSGQRFARFIFSLKPDLDRLRESASDGLLPGAEAGIRRLLPYMDDLTDYVGELGAELGRTADRAGRALTSPFWSRFFTLVGNEGVPTLRGLVTVTGNVAVGVAGMVQAFIPFERSMGRGLIGLTERFANFSQGMSTNKGFQEFIRYASVEGPRVVATIGELIRVGVRVGQAYAPVGSIVLGVLRGVASALNAIPLPVLTGLVVGITAYRSAALLAAGAQAVLNSGLVTGIARMITFGSVTTTTMTTAGAIPNTVTGATRAINAMSGAIGGPFVLALTGAIAAIGYFVSANQQAKNAIDTNARALGDIGDEYKRTGKVSAESIASMVQQNPKLRDLTNILKEQNLTVEDLGKSYENNAALQNRIAEAARARAAADRAAFEATVGTKQGGKFGDQELLKRSERSKELAESLAKSYEDARLKADVYTAAVERGAEATKSSNNTFEDATPAVRKLGDAYKILADSTSSAADKARALKDAEDLLFGSARAADEAAEAQAKALINTNKVLEVRDNLTGKGAKTLDLNTEAGQRLRDSLKDQLAAINATFRARVADGESIESATKKHDEEVEALKKNATQHGINKAAVQNLIDIYGKVPPSKSTDVTISGIDATKAQLDELLVYQTALREGISLATARGRLHPDVASPGGRGGSRGSLLAEGGPVVGPGTGTSDSVPAMERRTGAPFMLSNGEFVQPTASVDYYGQGFMEALRRRQVPRNAVRGYAAGGLVQQFLTEHYPFPTTTNMTRIPTRAEVAAVVQPPWPSSPGAQRGDSGVWRSVLALIKSGPGGGTFGNAYRPGDPLWHGCVPMDTVVLTRRGWVPFEDVQVGEDETVGYNPATGRSEWTRIVGMHHYQDAELWTITAGDWTAEVTPGHRWLTDTGLVETRDFTNGTRVRLATPLADDVTGVGLVDGDVRVDGVQRAGARQAEVFCPTTTLGTWTARQGSRVFLTGNSGRAVDWMGFNQDALAQYLAAHRPLELIHRTKTRDYAYTRGVNKGSFNNALMEAHRNHIHIALAKGGLVDSLPFGVFDSGGTLAPGLNLAYNGLGRPEVLRREDQPTGPVHVDAEVRVFLGTREITDVVRVEVDSSLRRVARDIQTGTRV
ncbi:hypothetical protein GCM10009827_083860 [Dactylosporangium maewongense]|uniref:Hint domain-containing protein n=1 Tax=Dactylosporangium maewongense TaxID=634393 RepID=A0ABP4MV44_9ACTN